MTPGSKPLFAWYAKSFDPAVASIRLRCLAPMTALGQLGVAVEQFDASRRAVYDAVVFSKTYDDEAFAEAAALCRTGKRVIFDICDNHFAGDESGETKLAERSARLRRMLLEASEIVASTPTLAAQIAARVPDIAERMRVIPDQLDDETAADQRPTWGKRFALWRLKRFLGRHRTSLHLVWFGNNGSGHMQSGFADLKRIRPVIETFHRTHPVTLSVIANSRRRYRRLAAEWTTPIHYMAWARTTIGQALALHDAAVIPVSQNDFTLGKSINRPATALLAGLGVIADAIPSYEELRPFIALDDWPVGLARYAAHRDEDRSAIAHAQAHLRRTYSSATIGQLWRDVLVTE